MGSQPPPDVTIPALVSGILSDVRDLLSVEWKIAWSRFQEELRKAKASAAAFAFGLGLTLLGTLLLMQMVVQLVYDYFSLPLWGSYGVVGLAGLGIGALFFVKSRW
ncbi:MAG: phage holin family protein [Candidatus Binatia bacterium]